MVSPTSFSSVVVTCSGSRNNDQASDLRRAGEWDPEYDSRGVQAFTALGENGLAPVEWVEMPEINRTPPNLSDFKTPIGIIAKVELPFGKMRVLLVLNIAVSKRFGATSLVVSKTWQLTEMT